MGTLDFTISGRVRQPDTEPAGWETTLSYSRMLTAPAALLKTDGRVFAAAFPSFFMPQLASDGSGRNRFVKAPHPLSAVILIIVKKTRLVNRLCRFKGS
jgi:hypothetical protein